LLKNFNKGGKNAVGQRGESKGTVMVKILSRRSASSKKLQTHHKILLEKIINWQDRNCAKSKRRRNIRPGGNKGSRKNKRHGDSEKRKRVLSTSIRFLRRTEMVNILDRAQ